MSELTLVLPIDVEPLPAEMLAQIPTQSLETGSESTSERKEKITREKLLEADLDAAEVFSLIK